MNWLCTLGLCAGWSDLSSYERISAFIAAVGVGLLAWYTIVTHRLHKTTEQALWETRRSNDTAERSLELGNRAWLVARIGSYISDMGPNECSTSVAIENLGSIPATSIVLRSYAKYLASVPYTISDSQLADHFLGSMGSGHDRSLSLSLPSLRIAENQSASEAGMTLFLYCRIDYADWFQKPRFTEACWSWAESRGWVPTPQHNRFV
jgi:hypothetical protein